MRSNLEACHRRCVYSLSCTFPCRFIICLTLVLALHNQKTDAFFFHSSSPLLLLSYIPPPLLLFFVQKPEDIRSEMNTFASNGIKPTWTPSFKNTHHINAVNFLAQQKAQQNSSTKQRTHLRRNSFFSTPPPAAPALNFPSSSRFTTTSTASTTNSASSFPTMMSTTSSAVFNHASSGDGRSRRRSIHVLEESSAKRSSQGLKDTSSPRSDGMHLHQKPRAALRKNHAFLTASRQSKKQDRYDGSWRVRNTSSSLYECGVRGTTSDMGAQRALQKRMQGHKLVMAQRWKNGGSLF